MRLLLSDGLVSLKVVLFGAGGVGKASTIDGLQRLFGERATVEHIVLGESAEAQRLHWRPRDQAPLSGLQMHIELWTLPGWSTRSGIRQLLLDGVDAVVLVVDSRSVAQAANIAARRDLAKQLAAVQAPRDLPILVQMNKQDLDELEPAEAILAGLRLPLATPLATVAAAGDGLPELARAIADALAASVGPQLARATQLQSSDETSSSDRTSTRLDARTSQRYGTGSASSSSRHLVAQQEARARRVGIQEADELPSLGAAAAPKTGGHKRGLGEDKRVAGFLMLGHLRLLESLSTSVYGSRYRLSQATSAETYFGLLVDPQLNAHPAWAESLKSITAQLRQVSTRGLHKIIEARRIEKSCVILGEDIGAVSMLDAVMEQHGQMSQSLALAVIQQVVETLAECERAGVHHGGLRPECLAIDHSGQVFVCDLALPKPMDLVLQMSRALPADARHYLPPEALQGSQQATAAADVFALGLILSEMLLGHGVLVGADAGALLQAWSQQPPIDFKSSGAAVSRELTDLIRAMLDPDPSMRPDDFVGLQEQLARLGAAGKGATAKLTRREPARSSSSKLQAVTGSGSRRASGSSSSSKLPVPTTSRRAPRPPAAPPSRRVPRAAVVAIAVFVLLGLGELLLPAGILGLLGARSVPIEPAVEPAVETKPGGIAVSPPPTSGGGKPAAAPTGDPLLRPPVGPATTGSGGTTTRPVAGRPPPPTAPVEPVEPVEEVLIDFDVQAYLDSFADAAGAGADQLQAPPPDPLNATIKEELQAAQYQTCLELLPLLEGRKRRTWLAIVARHRELDRDRVEIQLEAAESLPAMRQALLPALTQWGTRADWEWAQFSLINFRRAIGENLPTLQTVVSPAAMSSLRAGMQGTRPVEIDKYLQTLPAEGEEARAVRAWVQLWHIRGPVLGAALRAGLLGQPTIATTRSDKPWQIVDASRQGLGCVRTGLSTRFIAWDEFEAADLRRLWQQLAANTGAKDIHLAAATAVLLAQGQDAAAAAMAIQARDAGFRRADDLQTVIELFAR